MMGTWWKRCDRQTDGRMDRQTDGRTDRRTDWTSHIAAWSQLKNVHTICTGYKEKILVLESGYFFDYLCHWNWFLLSLLIFILFLYFFNSRGRVPLAGNSLRAEKSHWQVQKVTLAGPKSHTRAKISHWSVIISSKVVAFEYSLMYLHSYMGPPRCKLNSCVRTHQCRIGSRKWALSVVEL